MPSRWLLGAYLISIPLSSTIALGAACDGTPLPPGAGYRVANGRIYAPDGTPFTAKGVNDMNIISDWQALLADYPGVNHVRVPVYNFQNPADFATAITELTKRGVVVELENHTSPDGSGYGGSQGAVPYPDSTYWNQDMAWYAAVGRTYASNPLVWVGSENEPPMNDPQGLVNWQQAEYSAFRQYSTAPFELEINGWADVNSFGANQPSGVFQNDTNLVADVHLYPWLTNGGDLNTDASFISQAVGNFQRSWQTKEGPLPVIFGEFGYSTTGGTLDNNGYAMVQATLASGYGFDAFWFAQGTPYNGLLNADGSLTYFGQLVGQGIAGATGCPNQPPPPNYVPDPNTVYESVTASLYPTQAQLDLGQKLAMQAQRQKLQVASLTPLPPVAPFVSTNNGFTATNVGTLDTKLPPFEPITVATETRPIDTGNPTINAVVNDVAGHLPMISPIGTLILQLDQNLTQAGDQIINQHLAAYSAIPVVLAELAIALLGLRILKGDAAAKFAVPGTLAKIGIIILLSTNPGDFDTYVRNFFYDSLPNFMTPAGQLMGNAGNGMNTMASSIDYSWSIVWTQVTKVNQQAGTFDIASPLAAIIAALACGGALLITAMVYFVARFLLMITIYFGNYAISMLLFPETKRFFDGWLGKAVSLVLVQVGAVVTMTILNVTYLHFLDQIAPLANVTQGGALAVPAKSVPTLASDLETLVSMVIFFGGGAFVMWFIPTVAYSIGGAVAVSMMPLFLAATGAAQATASIVAGMASGVGKLAGRGDGSEPLSLGLNTAGSGMGNSLAAATPRALGSMSRPELEN